jgi:hypothetical protein
VLFLDLIEPCDHFHHFIGAPLFALGLQLDGIDKSTACMNPAGQQFNAIPFSNFIVARIAIVRISAIVTGHFIFT